MTVPESEKRLIEFYKDMEYILYSFGNTVLVKELSHTELMDEAREFVKRNAQIFYALLKT